MPDKHYISTIKTNGGTYTVKDNEVRSSIETEKESFLNVKVVDEVVTFTFGLSSYDYNQVGSEVTLSDAPYTQVGSEVTIQ